MAAAGSTAEKILDIAQEFIQCRGYSAISLNEIAEAVGIRKPSLLHHFKSKADLGQSVIYRYRTNFSDALDGILKDETQTALQAFDFYCGPYLELGRTEDKICLCGSLSGEFMALPEQMKYEVQQFFQDHIIWLSTVLEKGRQSGEFNFTSDIQAMAQLIVDSLQGALMIKRATGNHNTVLNAIHVLKIGLHIQEDQIG